MAARVAARVAAQHTFSVSSMPPALASNTMVLDRPRTRATRSAGSKCSLSNSISSAMASALRARFRACAHAGGKGCWHGVAWPLDGGKPARRRFSDARLADQQNVVDALDNEGEVVRLLEWLQKRGAQV